MGHESVAKPSVLDWLNPNNTVHNNTGLVFGFGSLDPNPKPKTSNLLVALCSKEVLLSLLLSLSPFNFAPDFRVFALPKFWFSTAFQQVFNSRNSFQQLDGDANVVWQLHQQDQGQAMPLLRYRPTEGLVHQRAQRLLEVQSAQEGCKGGEGN